MRQLSLCLWTMLALLILVPSSMGQIGRRANTPQGAEPSIFQRWFKPNVSSQEPKKEAKKAPTATPTPPPPQPATPLMLNPRDAEALRRAEEEKWLRRANVCNKLRKLAIQAGDDELLRKADYLDHAAWDAYQQRTGKATPMNSAVAVQGDADYIGQYLRKQGDREPDFTNRQAERRVRANWEEEP